MNYSFKAAFPNPSPRTPPLCIFRMYFLSRMTFALFERKCPAKWPDIPPWFQFETICICSIQRALKCAKREFKLYLFTEVQYVMSHLSVCEDVAGSGAAQIHEWMFRNVPAQGIRSNEHCVGIISIGTHFMHVALFWRAVIWIRCVNLREDWDW